MVSCWKTAERSRDWFTPVRDPAFCPNTWFCPVDSTPVTSDGDTPTRRNELFRLLHFWSSRADHRLVFSVVGKFPRSAFSPTKEAGSGATPAGTTDAPGPTAANPLHTTAFTVCAAGHDTGTGNCAPGPGLRLPPDNPAATAPKSSRFTSTLEADPSSNP